MPKLKKGEMMTAGHLGGYVVGGDDATYYPDLWRWIVAELKPSNMLDMGCGEGHALKFFAKLGVDSWGVDGVKQRSESVDCHDFTDGKYMFGPADLIWSCEFVEHVEEKFLPNIMNNFGQAKYVFLTHAIPGQAGYHHVNCQPSSYWIGAMAAVGLQFDVRLTTAARQHAAKNPSPWNHFAQRGLVFKSYDAAD